MAALTHTLIFRVGCFSFLIGVLCGDLYSIAGGYLAGLVALVLCLASIIFFRITLIVVISSLLLVGGFWWSLDHMHVHDEKEKALKNQTAIGTWPTTQELEVIRLYKVDERNTQYLVSQISSSGIKFLLHIPKNLSLTSGDQLTIQEKIYFPQDRDGTFSYRSWMDMQGIYGNIYARIFTVEQKGETMDIFSRIRAWGYGIIDELYPREHGKFLAGILLGERRDIDEETKEHFIRSGLMHIIAVSGFNITILLLFCSVVLRAFPVWLRVLSTVVIVTSFVGIVGLQVPVMRAGIMGLIAYIGLSYGQRFHTFHLLLATFVGFVIYNPLALVHDLSMLLSFGAVLGILVFQRPIHHLCRHIPNTFELREAIVMTICSMVFTLPMSLVFFGQFSVISPLANILSGAAIPPAMLFGFVSIILHPLSEVLSVGVGWIGWVVLNYILEVVRWTGSLGWAALPVDLGVYRWHFFWSYYLLVSAWGLFVVKGGNAR